MLSKSNISFNITDCPDEQLLRDYQQGILSRDQIRIIETHLADCEMCSDYLEGFALLSNEKELDNEVQLIVSKIYNKASKKNKIWLYATAASLFIAIALTSLILLFPSKNNYVADETITLIPKEDQPVTGTKQPDNLGWIKNETEISGKEVARKQTGEKTIIDSRNKRAEVVSIDDAVNIPIQAEQEITESDNATLNTQTNTGIADKVTVLKEEEQSPGYFEKAGVTDEKKLEDNNVLAVTESKSSKKNKVDQSNYKSEDSKGVFAGDIMTGQASAPNKSAEETVTTSTGLSTIVQNNESLISDLDKANDFLNKEQADSAVVYALRGVNSSNDNNKWKSKLCLAKAYIAKGEKEKAIIILKEIKAKASYRISKDADAELEKLGN